MRKRHSRRHRHCHKPSHHRRGKGTFAKGHRVLRIRRKPKPRVREVEECEVLEAQILDSPITVTVSRNKSRTELRMMPDDGSLSPPIFK